MRCHEKWHRFASASIIFSVEIFAGSFISVPSFFSIFSGAQTHPTSGPSLKLCQPYVRALIQPLLSRHLKSTKSTVLRSSELENTAWMDDGDHCHIFVMAFITSSFSRGSATQQAHWVSDTAATQWCSPYPESCRSRVGLAAVRTLPRFGDMRELDWWDIYPFISYLRLLKWVSCCFTLFAFDFDFYPMFELCFPCSSVSLQIQQLAAWDGLLSPRILKLVCYMLGTIKLVALRGPECLCLQTAKAVIGRNTADTHYWCDHSKGNSDHSEIAGSLKYDLWMNQVGKTWNIPGPLTKQSGLCMQDQMTNHWYMMNDMSWYLHWLSAIVPWDSLS